MEEVKLYSTNEHKITNLYSVYSNIINDPRNKELVETDIRYCFLGSGILVETLFRQYVEGYSCVFNHFFEECLTPIKNEVREVIMEYYDFIE